ncbi:MAG TPA: hypothetical protein PKD55_13890 [Bellilinea sp.]|nr:hypothetical protein [Bellilinea sp.]
MQSHDRMENHAGRTTVGCDAIFTAHFNAGVRSADLPDISPAYPAHNKLTTGNWPAIGMDWKCAA